MTTITQKERGNSSPCVDKCKTTHPGGKREFMGDLTKRDQEMLDYIKEYMSKNGITPTMTEIGEGVGMYSTKTVFTHFQKLIEKGYIKRITKGKTFRYAVAGMHYVERDDV